MNHPPNCIRKAITDAYYEGRNAGYSMEWAADKATRDVWDALLAEGRVLCDLDSLHVGYGEEFLVLPISKVGAHDSRSTQADG